MAFKKHRHKGREIEKLINTCNLVCLNTGAPTRMIPMDRKFLELAFCSHNLANKCSFSVITDKWSDHFSI